MYYENHFLATFFDHSSGTMLKDFSNKQQRLNTAL